jgi:hypothetical protein
VFTLAPTEEYVGSAGSELKEIMEQHSYEVETSDTITSIALS